MHPAEGRVVAQFLNEAESDGFDCISAVAAHCGHAVDRGLRNIGVKPHSGDALDGIDRGDSVCSSPQGRLGSRAHVRDVGGQLGQDGNVRPLSGRCREALHQLRDLADVGAQTTLCHIGTGKIELYRVCTVFRAEPRQLLPLGFVLAHDGREDDFGRIFLFQFPEDLHVLGHTVIRELFSVFEADDGTGVRRDRRKPG